jgi:hypothetical protein
MASAVLPVTGRAGRIDRSSRPLERTTTILTMCKASMRAQKFLFGALVTAAQQTGDCAHNGGYLRAQLLFQLDPSRLSDRAGVA